VLEFALILSVLTSPLPPRGTQKARGVATPILVLLHHSVWFSSVDRPWFILYDDGTVLYPKEREQQVPLSYQRTRLNGQAAELLARFGLDDGFWSLDSLYDFRPMVTDQETIFLLIWNGAHFKRVGVRAAMEEGGKLSSKVPQAFKQIFDRLESFRSDSSTPWFPDSIQVAAWPYEYAPDNPPLQWRSEWPDLKSRDTQHRADPYVKELHLMMFPYRYLPALDSLLARRREKQAIAINGRKWAVGYRFVFPGERRWRDYIHNLEQ